MRAPRYHYKCSPVVHGALIENALHKLPGTYIIFLLCISAFQSSNAVSNQVEWATLNALLPSLEVLQRSFAPSEKKPQGEVRLLKKENKTHLQILIYSKSLNRPFREIQKREQTNWPHDSLGYAASRNFLTSLKAAKDRVQKSTPAKNDKRPTYTWVIEFINTPTFAQVLFDRVEFREEEGEKLIEHRHTLEALGLPNFYALRNMALICSKSFKMSEEDAHLLLQHAANP